MARVIVFRLAAPLAAFGDLTVGERRTTWPRPSHSAMAGLVAASLGMARQDPGHEALAASFGLAVRTDHPGTPLADYHTAQTPPYKKGRRFATRREETADKRILGTIISRRDYLCDAVFTILLWPDATSPYAPEAIVEALNRPVFVPYVGRRSCPLGAPMAARIVEAETIVAAFAAYDRLRDLCLDMERPSNNGPIAFDQSLRDVAGLKPVREESRRDRLTSRARWQFEPRLECVAPPTAEGGARP